MGNPKSEEIQVRGRKPRTDNRKKIKNKVSASLAVVALQKIQPIDRVTEILLPFEINYEDEGMVSNDLRSSAGPPEAGAVGDGGTQILALRSISATTQCFRLLSGLDGSSLT